MLLSLALPLTLLVSRPAQADFVPREDPPVENSLENRAIVALTNTALGAVMGCIGSEISGDGCVDGLWKGGLGGAVTYAGMELGSYNAHVPFTGILGRQIVNLGSSMTSNAMFSRGLLERYETDFGPIVFSIDSNEGFNLGIMPLSTGILGYHLIAGHKLDLLESIEDGTFVFRLDWGDNDLYNTGGYTTSNIPMHITGNQYGRSHENNHTYQLSSFRWADEIVPELGPIRYGGELLFTAVNVPSMINHEDIYPNHPLELEAYTMQR